MAYSYTNSKGQQYFLHSKEVKLQRSNKIQTIYYFSKQTGQGAVEELPSGYEVFENTRTGLPVLRKNR